jgi:hypothetical protein
MVGNSLVVIVCLEKDEGVGMDSRCKCHQWGKATKMRAYVQ